MCLLFSFYLSIHLFLFSINNFLYIAHLFIHVFIYSLILSFTHSLLITSFMLPFTHSFIHSYFHSLIHSFIHTSIQSLIQSFIRSLINSYSHSCIHIFTYSFICSQIHSYIHPFIHIFTHSLTQEYEQRLGALGLGPDKASWRGATKAELQTITGQPQVYRTQFWLIQYHCIKKRGRKNAWFKIHQKSIHLKYFCERVIVYTTTQIFVCHYLLRRKACLLFTHLLTQGCNLFSENTVNYKILALVFVTTYALTVLTFLRGFVVI